MQLTTIFKLCSLLCAATSVSAACNSDNCLRAVKASAFPTRSGIADCSSYLAATVSPAPVPTYASACSGGVRFASACSCLGVTSAASPTTSPTLTITPTATSNPSSTSKSVDTSSGYVIVSPTAGCPAATPTGAFIGESDQGFLDTYGGLQYKQYENMQFVVQDNNQNASLLDLSKPDRITVSDMQGYSLVIFADNSYNVFVGTPEDCELEIVGHLPPQAQVAARDAFSHFSPNLRNVLLDRAVGPCDAVQAFCANDIGATISGFAAAGVCGILSAQIGAEVGGYIGFLGNVFGPEVGIPTTLLGTFLGGRLGAFLGDYYGQILCGGATAKLAYEMCQSVVFPTDPNNCGECGNVCPSGTCRHGQCATAECAGSQCASLNQCPGGCFCFQAADNTGFCGPSTSCAPLADCSSDANCAFGQICATGTCCERNVCLSPCGASSRREELLSLRGNMTESMELFTTGKGPA